MATHTQWTHGPRKRVCGWGWGCGGGWLGIQSAAAGSLQVQEQSRCAQLCANLAGLCLARKHGWLHEFPRRCTRRAYRAWRSWVTERQGSAATGGVPAIWGHRPSARWSRGPRMRTQRAERDRCFVGCALLGARGMPAGTQVRARTPRCSGGAPNQERRRSGRRARGDGESLTVSHRLGRSGGMGGAQQAPRLRAPGFMRTCAPHPLLARTCPAAQQCTSMGIHTAGVL
jgi:hypothetical protein